MDCGFRLLYAVAGHHHRKHRPSLNGAKPRGKSVAYAHGHCLLCADRGGDAARQRLAGGQSRRAQYFLYRHRAVYSRFTVLRAFRHAERTVAGTRVTGRWRRDDGAGRQIDGDENRTARAIYGGDDLCHVTRSGRSAARSGARRSAGGVRVVALDLFDQHSGGDYRCDRHIDVNAELHYADAAL